MSKHSITLKDRLLAWCAICRLPNLFTVPGDCLVGFLAGGGKMTDLRWLWVAAAALMLYLVGLISNDLMDLDEDRKERPERPLPSGKIPQLAAALVLLTLVFGALKAASYAGLKDAGFAGKIPVYITGFMLFLIFAYNYFKKYYPLGAMLIALCRVFSVVLGLAAAGLDIVNPLLLSSIPLIWFFYIFGVAQAAHRETSRRRVAGRVIILFTPLLWGFMALISNLPSIRYFGGLPPWLAVGFLGVLIFMVISVMNFYRLRGKPEPKQVQNCIGELLTGFIFLQASACIFVGSPFSGGHITAVVLMVLWIPARLAGRFFAGS